MANTRSDADSAIGDTYSDTVPAPGKVLENEGKRYRGPYGGTNEPSSKCTQKSIDLSWDTCYEERDVFEL